MNFVQHPSYSKQINDIQLILSNITIENLNKVLERFDLQCISFEHLQTSGRINLIFNLTTQSKSHTSRDLILKIANSHCYWKEYRTKNEVYTMEYLLKHTTIPIPKVIDYSNDSTTSILSCEYILMEKVHGHTLESVIEKMSDDVLFKIVIQIIQYVKQLRQIRLPQMNQIGSFSSKDMCLGKTIEDGPALGPFPTIQQYIIEHLRWAIHRIETDKQLENGKHLILSLQKIIDDAQIDLNLTDPKIKFHFTHADLNTSNILVNENTGEVLAILDWERSAMTCHPDDTEFYLHWFENNQRKEYFKLLIQQEKDYLDLIDGIYDMQKIKWYLDITYSIMYATFYSCTWFENEKTVIEHIEHFLKQTEDAITAFNNHMLTRFSHIRNLVDA